MFSKPEENPGFKSVIKLFSFISTKPQSVAELHSPLLQPYDGPELFINVSQAPSPDHIDRKSFEKCPIQVVAHSMMDGTGKVEAGGKVDLIFWLHLQAHSSATR